MCSVCIYVVLQVWDASAAWQICRWGCCQAAVPIGCVCSCKISERAKYLCKILISLFSVLIYFIAAAGTNWEAPMAGLLALLTMLAAVPGRLEGRQLEVSCCKCQHFACEALLLGAQALYC